MADAPKLYTDHIGLKSNVSRTTWNGRPEWMDQIKRPLRIAANTENEFGLFRAAWRLNIGELKRVREIHDIYGVAKAMPLLVLNDAFSDDLIVATNPVKLWLEHGGKVIDVPEHAIIRMKDADGVTREPHFTDVENLMASTIVQIALREHLDGLNRR